MQGEEGTTLIASTQVSGFPVAVRSRAGTEAAQHEPLGSPVINVEMRKTSPQIYWRVVVVGSELPSPGGDNAGLTGRCTSMPRPPGVFLCCGNGDSAVTVSSRLLLCRIPARHTWLCRRGGEVHFLYLPS